MTESLGLKVSYFLLKHDRALAHISVKALHLWEPSCYPVMSVGASGVLWHSNEDLVLAVEACQQCVYKVAVKDVLNVRGRADPSRPVATEATLQLHAVGAQTNAGRNLFTRPLLMVSPTSAANFSHITHTEEKRLYKGTYFNWKSEQLCASSVTC